MLSRQISCSLSGAIQGGPTSAMAYAIQARNEIRRALEAEIADGLPHGKTGDGVRDSDHAYTNQYDCFDISGTRANIAKAA